MFPLLLILLGLSTVACLPQPSRRLPEYHQNDYDVKIERTEVIWHNESYVRNLKIEFPFYNRSQRVINGSGYLMIDQTSRDFVGELQILKFMSNEYRYFPITVSANLCEEYANNRCNFREMRKQTQTNLPDGCLVKKGFYYIYNAIFDFSTLPPLIPRGRYKAVGKLYYKKEFVAEGHTYAEVKDKPMKWLKK